MSFRLSTVILVPASCSHHHTAQLGHHTPVHPKQKQTGGFQKLLLCHFSSSLKTVCTSPLYNLGFSCILQPSLVEQLERA